MSRVGARSVMVVVGLSVALLYGAAAWLVVRALRFLVVGAPDLLTTVVLVVGLTIVFGVVSLRASTRQLLSSLETVEVTSLRAPETTRRLTALADCMDVDTPRLLLADLETPNALSVATGNAGAVVIDQELFQLLDADELEAIIAHELAHLASRDSLVQTIAVSTLRTLAGFLFVAMLPVFLLVTGVARGVAWARGRPTDWATTIPGRFRSVIERSALGLLFVLTLAVRAHSRRREFAADDRAASVTGNPVALASALQKIDTAAQPSIGLLSSLYTRGETTNESRFELLSTHPGTDERVRRLLEREDIRRRPAELG